MILMHYIYYVLYSYCCFIIYNETSIHHTIKQNRWKPRAFCLATIWSHLGTTGGCDTQSALFMPVTSLQLLLLQKTLFQCVGSESRFFSAFVATSGYSALTLIQNTRRFKVVSNTLLRSPPLSNFKQLIFLWPKADLPYLFTNE